MADTKISALTELTERREEDELVVVETSSGITKRMTAEKVTPALMLSDYDGDLAAAVTAIDTSPRTLIINVVPDALSGSVTVPSTLNLHWLKGCILVTTGYTLTLNGPLTAGNYQLFSGTGTIAGAQTLPYIPADWFAGTESVTMTTALAAADIIEVLAELGVTVTGTQINTAGNLCDGITATDVEINTVATGTAAKNTHVHDVYHRGAIGGLGISNNSTDANYDIDIAVGGCRNDDHDGDIILSSALTKRIDANWVEGTNQGGLDTGSFTASTEYHVFLIYNPTSETSDVLFSASFSSPTMPTDYTKKRILGSIYAETTPYIIGFSQEGDEFLWDDPPMDIDTTQGTSATLRTLSVATERKCRAILNVMANHATLLPQMYISSPDADDEAPNDTVAPLCSLKVQVAQVEVVHNIIVRTDTNGQVRSRSTETTTSIKIATLGWLDRRGKDD